VADISLDDLLPVNDSVYEPPDDLMEVFAKGGPAWELADLLKWVNGADEKFAAGWQAGIFEVVLKLGCAFGTWVRTSCVDDFVQRARAFGRKCKTGKAFNGDTWISVEAHSETVAEKWKPYAEGWPR